MRKPSATLRVIAASLCFAVLPGMACGSSDGANGGPANTAGKSGAGENRAGATSVAGAGAGTSSAGATPVTAGASGAGASGAGASAGHAGTPAAAGSSGAHAGSSGNSAGGAPGGSACERAGLVWKTANKTNYTSYPEPGSDECVKFSGCLYEGLFAACDQKQTLDWVKTHNIVAAFPDLETLELHDLCLKSGNKTIVVTVYDTCGDSDCDNCCTQNKGNKDELIDIESFTDARWGVPDGPIEWADLGPTQGSGCN